MNKNSLKGIGLFAFELVHLVSLGKQEIFDTIEEHISKGNIVEYIYEKYKNDFSIPFSSDSPYDISAINKYYNNFDGVINGEERRKYGIEKQTDGLLLLIAVLMDKVEKESPNWVIE